MYFKSGYTKIDGFPGSCRMFSKEIGDSLALLCSRCYNVGFSVISIVRGDREVYKETNSLHLPNERFSPVRRASDSLTSMNKYQVKGAAIFLGLFNYFREHSFFCTVFYI